MKKRTAMFLAAAMAAMCATAEPTVTDVVAKQRYPWNGLVDITCKVTGIDGTTPKQYFELAAVMPDSGKIRYAGQFWIIHNGAKAADLLVQANGNYHLLWDAQADLGQVRYENMIVRATLTVHQKVQLWEGGPYWATTNIGAENPEDYGYYFWWGDTVGYKRENNKWVATDGSSSNFSFNSGNTPTYNKSTSTLQSEGWITADGVLAPAHDAAQVRWGGSWRMPTGAEFFALISKCTTTWTTRNGVYGRLVTGKGAYADRSIFLPAAGLGYDSSLYDPGSLGLYWSSAPNSDDSGRAWRLGFNSGYFYRDYSDRYRGQSVRPVQGFESSVGTYTITYSPGANGSGAEQTATKTHDVALTLKSAIYTRDGYTQTGWATSDGGAKTYDLCAPYAANSAVTLYPFWVMESVTDAHNKVQLWENGPYWATTNIGADNPEDYGYYFWWGDTVGYKRENDKWVASDGLSANYSFSSGNTPTYNKSTSTLQSEGWITADGVFAPAYDAAHVHWGGNWRMPTDAEFSALISNCTTTWTTQNGVYGRLVTGKGAYADRSIFLPAAGYGDDSGLFDPGSYGNYWFSTPGSDYSGYACYLHFHSSYFDWRYSYFRYVGKSVRPVRGFAE